MIRLLANENIPLDTIKRLQKKGIKISSITEIAPGLKDEKVIKKAVDEKSILLTFDKDFGELVFRAGYKTKGVILLRIEPRSPEYIAKMVLKLLTDRNFKIEGHFCVISEQKIRLIPLK